MPPMPWMRAIYTETAREKLAEHGIGEDEVQRVLQEAEQYTTSRSSGLPLGRGWTDAGRYLVVVYHELDSITVEGITAYEPL